MMNQAEDLIAAPKPQSSNTTYSNKTGILFTSIGLICMGVAFGFGFLQLWQANTKLVRNVTDLQTQLQQANKKVTTMQTTVTGLQSMAQQAQATAERQEKMFAEWQVSQQDITEIYLQLNFLNAQLDTLVLPSNPLAGYQKNILATSDNTPPSSWWRSLLDKLMQMLSKIVIISPNNGKRQPLVMPEAKAFLYQNLHAQMENVMWSVLHRNNEVYHASLLRMTQWINTYFALDNVQTQNVLKDLQRLQTVQITANKGSSLNN